MEQRNINHTRPITEGTEVSIKRSAKDSVFCDLFQDPDNLLELYRCLHPEDSAATTADIGNVTLRNILVEDQYNDLGFTVRDKQLILMEAQSTWSRNIVLRILMYLTETWNGVGQRKSLQHSSCAPAEAGAVCALHR